MRFGVFGAGSIGCYLGGHLAAAEPGIVLVGRQQLGKELETHGITLTSGRSSKRIPPADFTFATEAEALIACDAILVCVKGLDTREAGQQLAAAIRAGAKPSIVLSMQNGLRNAQLLQQALADVGSSPPQVFAGMVPFNVRRMEHGRFHRGTDGRIVFDAAVPQPVQTAFAHAALPYSTHPDMEAVLWGKLIFNLNNALNALSDLPLRDQINDRRHRRLLAAAMREALQGLRRARIRPVGTGRMIPHLAPMVLELPDTVFRVVARHMVNIDPDARSSMWEDLQRGRRTEIALINGEVVRLGHRVGVPTPINAAIVEAIEHAESTGSVDPEVRERLLARAG